MRMHAREHTLPRICLNEYVLCCKSQGSNSANLNCGALDATECGAWGQNCPNDNNAATESHNDDFCRSGPVAFGTLNVTFDI